MDENDPRQTSSHKLHIHLLGICGTGMAALAGILKEQGYQVTGSDEHVYPPMSTLLEGLGIPLQNGYRPENLVPTPDLVVVGNVIRRDNPEAQAVLAQDLPRLSLPEALNRFLVGDRQSVVVAGTHGKTTTTALIAWLCFALGLDPGFMVGGIAKNFQTNYRVGSGRYVVMEGDEYDTAFFDKRPKFVHFTPRAAVLTSIEFDHADIYPDLDVIIAGLRDLPVHHRSRRPGLRLGGRPPGAGGLRAEARPGFFLRSRRRRRLAGHGHHPRPRRHELHRPEERAPGGESSSCPWWGSTTS